MPTSQTVTGRLDLRLGLRASKTTDLGSLVTTAVKDYSWAVAAGTGAGAANVLWADERTLAGEASEELDLAGGLTDAFGDTVQLDHVKLLVAKNADDSEANLVLGGAAANAWEPWAGEAGGTLVLPPGGLLLLAVRPAGGLAVSAGSADKLKLANAGAEGEDLSYQIVLLGVDA